MRQQSQELPGSISSNVDEILFKVTYETPFKGPSLSWL
jgi:hypothetical protein